MIFEGCEVGFALDAGLALGGITLGGVGWGLHPADPEAKTADASAIRPIPSLRTVCDTASVPSFAPDTSGRRGGAWDRRREAACDWLRRG